MKSQQVKRDSRRMRNVVLRHEQQVAVGVCREVGQNGLLGRVILFGNSKRNLTERKRKNKAIQGKGKETRVRRRDQRRGERRERG
jgi:hypothetical protein